MPLPHEVLQKHALVLWDYHRMHHAVRESADCILGLGSYDLRVADECAPLYLRGMAPLVLFTGKHGNWTKSLYPISEARSFAERAVAQGVPTSALLLEEQATNTGENIIFSQALLAKHALDVKKIILVTKPNMERRAYATCKKNLPHVHVTLASPQKDIRQLKAAELTPLVHEMVGDLQRIMMYPQYGYQIAQEIPQKVLESYEALCAHGYTQHLMK